MDTITFESGATFHLTGWSVSGSAPSTFVQVEASTPGVAFDLVNDTAGVFTSTYVIFSDAHASVDALWTAGTGCEDWGGNVGLFDEDSPVVGDRIFFDPGATYNITGWTVNGSAGAAILITSNPPTASHSLIAISGGPFTSDWCVISHSDATPEADWTAGANSFDAGNNLANGWFTTTVYADVGSALVWIRTMYGSDTSTHSDVHAGWVDTVAGLADTAAGIIAASAQVLLRLGAPDTFAAVGVNAVEVLTESGTPHGETHADASASATANASTQDAEGLAHGRPSSAEIHTYSGAPDTSVDSDVIEVVGAWGIASTGMPTTQATGLARGALADVETKRPEGIASVDARDGASASLAASGVLGAGVGLPGGADVAVGTQGVGAGVVTDAPTIQIRVRTAPRIHTHPTRPPYIHQVIPRSMGERVISRVTIQVTIAYPKIEMGVPRWRM